MTERDRTDLADASKRLGVTAFALALLLAGAEPEETRDGGHRVSAAWMGSRSVSLSLSPRTLRLSQRSGSLNVNHRAWAKRENSAKRSTRQDVSVATSAMWLLASLR